MFRIDRILRSHPSQDDSNCNNRISEPSEEPAEWRMARDELIEARLTHSVIGAFYEVYTTLGFGFFESIYANALEVELKARGHRVAVRCAFRSSTRDTSSEFIASTKLLMKSLWSRPSPLMTFREEHQGRFRVT